MMDGKPRYTLELFAEQGSEGAHWCIYDNTKTGYEGLINLEDGMVLNIPGVWEGTIKKDTTTNRKWLRGYEDFIMDKNYRGLLETRGWDTKEMSNSDCKECAQKYYTQQVAGGWHCHWIQEGVNAEEWASWFIDKLEVEIIK